MKQISFILFMMLGSYCYGGITIRSSSPQENSIGENELQDGAVTSNKISTNAVSTDKLQNDAVTENKIADNAVNNAQIANAAITDTKIGTWAVTNRKILPQSITTTELDPSITIPVIRYFENQQSNPLIVVATATVSGGIGTFNLTVDRTAGGVNLFTEIQAIFCTAERNTAVLIDMPFCSVKSISVDLKQVIVNVIRGENVGVGGGDTIRAEADGSRVHLFVIGN